MSEATIDSMQLGSSDAEAGSLVRVESERIGAVEVPESEVIEMTSPIPGFAEAQRYCVLPTTTEEPSPFQWLQSIDKPDVSFIAINPFEFFPDYDIELPRPDQKELGIEGAGDVLLLSLVSIPPGKPEEITANLMAPVVINTRLNRGRQVILYESKYNTRHRLLPDPAQQDDPPDSPSPKEASDPPNAKAVGD